MNATASPTQSSLIGESAPFRAMLAHVSDLAPIDRPVLIIGERGTGKELVANRLALLSTRWNQPFLQLNCAALSESLLDSELFGHEAGAFTGANRRRASRFELADHGTIFLDEIANASLAVQEKLLRVIEYGVFERVGGNDLITVNVRVIAATHENLPALVDAKKFRADLLDRLAFDVIRIPPLRDRGEDIIHLAQHFAERMTSELGRTFFAGFAPEAHTQLLTQPWPGNVRELRNTVERSLYRETNWESPLARIRLDPFGSRPVPPDNNETLAATLANHHYNQRRTAAALGITYDQLRHRLRKAGLLPKSKAAAALQSEAGVQSCSSFLQKRAKKLS